MKDKKPSKQKYIIAAVCVVLLVVVALVFAIYSGEPKPDPASEKIIRIAAAIQLRSEAKIGKEPNDLTDEDFAKLTKLCMIPIAGSAVRIPWFHRHGGKNFIDLKKGELCDIKLLEKFTNLQELDLHSIKYPESIIPEWVKILRKYGINIANRAIIDLTPLEGLSNLQTLSLNDASVKNVEPLSYLINLKSLDISNTYVTNLKPLKKLENLEMLCISGCDRISNKQIDDLQKSLPNLKIYK